MGTLQFLLWMNEKWGKKQKHNSLYTLTSAVMLREVLMMRTPLTGGTTSVRNFDQESSYKLHAATKLKKKRKQSHVKCMVNSPYNDGVLKQLNALPSHLFFQRLLRSANSSPAERCFINLNTSTGTIRRGHGAFCSTLEAVQKRAVADFYSYTTVSFYLTLMCTDRHTHTHTHTHTHREHWEYKEQP